MDKIGIRDTQVDTRIRNTECIYGFLSTAYPHTVSYLTYFQRRTTVPSKSGCLEAHECDILGQDIRGVGKPARRSAPATLYQR
jgi:hypothetical protein